jgi:GAF domain-containing protein
MNPTMTAIPNEQKKKFPLGQLLDRQLIEQFDSVLNHAKERFRVPMARLAFIDKQGRWVRPIANSHYEQVAHSTFFCSQTILSEDVLVIPDAKDDGRFADNPLVVDPPHIRFYAGAPIIIPDGLILGSICIIDSHPRYDFSINERAILSALSREITYQILEKANVPDY